ncbi:phosphatase PAP2 family protein [Desertivirga arenae]|uniref:phosphatase PAP2 family protein n=1 Tax=Desertivirga arenae TaxID=2810309 RepID=UPI001A9675D6|nr:phosphatase PAP2 family protein [Pedobacter sp. SYSU D00823]
MKYLKLFVLLLFATTASAQKTDTLVKKLDSLEKKADKVGQNNNINPGAYNERTQITPRSYFILLWSDLKQQYTAPFRMTGQDWKRAGTFSLLAGALAFADKPVQKQAIKFKRSSNTASNISSFITNTGGIYESVALLGFGTYGFLFKNQKMQTTTFLASQAYLTSAAVSYTAKYLSGRQRPSVYSSDQVTADPTFRGPFADLGKDKNGKKQNSSFPSGHTTVAFAAATVYAMEYRDKPWVPILSYSAASLIGLSRLTENRHWATDVLVGAALGHLSGRQVVNNYHRYQKIKSAPSPSVKENYKKKRLSFGANYVDGQVLGSIRWSAQ